MIRTPKKINTNQGIVLFIALVFLFVSTLLGVSALRSNIFNEKMTLSTVQKESALEAAEVALLAGEDFVENYYLEIRDAVLGDSSGRAPTANAKQCTAIVAGSGGVCATKERSGAALTQYDNWVDITGDSNSLNVWSDPTKHRSLSDVIKNKYDLNTAPKYIVEFMAYIVDATGVSECETIDQSELEAWPYCRHDNMQFRITALATAGNYDETRIMLQSTYVVDN